MHTAPIPDNESDRLASLKKLNILDTPPEERFDRITKLATKIFKIPISTITLVDSNREWFKSVCGLDKKEGDRAISFCGHAMLENEILIIPDAKKDPRFSDNPMVIGEPFIRFYAGVPLFSADGARVGTFCIKGHDPREFSDEEKEIIKGMAKWVELEINSHNLSVAIEQVKKTVEEIDTFFETSQDIMAIANVNGYFERINPAALKMLGYSFKELIENPFIFFVHPDDKDITSLEIERLAKGALTINFVNRFRTKNNQYVWLQWNATPRGKHLYAIARNITDFKEKEIEMKKLNQFMIDRELRMIELKQELDKLQHKV